jgi:hypothetical protein
MHPSILEYYDGPQLILSVGKDSLFLCVAVEDDTFLATKVTEEWLDPFFKGDRDLLSTIKDSPSGEYRLIPAANISPTINETQFKKVSLDEVKALPEEGYFLNFKKPEEE